MKILPYFEEDEGAKCSYSISLKDNLEVLSKDQAKVISTYMESCVVIDEWLSNIKDPITGQFSIPSKTWCDGKYIWDSSHIFYLKNYRARLPEEFLNHVRLRLQGEVSFEGLRKDELRIEYESILAKLASGDESFYVRY
jgi:hypothetical protein